MSETLAVISLRLNRYRASSFTFSAVRLLDDLEAPNQHEQRAPLFERERAFGELLGDDTLNIATHDSLPMGVVSEVVGLEVFVPVEAEVEQYNRQAEAGELPRVGDSVGQLIAAAYVQTEYAVADPVQSVVGFLDASGNLGVVHLGGDFGRGRKPLAVPSKFLLVSFGFDEQEARLVADEDVSQ
jgi:hypothetical protein